MGYVDMYVASVPSANKEIFREHAMAATAMFKEYGAQNVVECWGESIPEGKLTSLPLAVKAQPDETVVFAWVRWPSREVRNRAWEAIEKDDRLRPGSQPFDGKRMIFGGFEPVVEA